MEEYILKDRCHCGGRVVVIPCKTEIRGTMVDVVSHGVCDTCLQNVTLPIEIYTTFVRDHCILRREVQ